MVVFRHQPGGAEAAAGAITTVDDPPMEMSNALTGHLVLVERQIQRCPVLVPWDVIDELLDGLHGVVIELGEVLDVTAGDDEVVPVRFGRHHLH